MTDSKAIELLAACRPVAVRLATAQATRLPRLNPADMVALKGLQQVRDYGYPYPKLKLLAQQAGLAPADLGTLSWLCREQNLTGAS